MVAHHLEHPCHHLNQILSYYHLILGNMTCLHHHHCSGLIASHQFFFSLFFFFSALCFDGKGLCFCLPMCVSHKLFHPLNKRNHPINIKLWDFIDASCFATEWITKSNNVLTSSLCLLHHRNEIRAISIPTRDEFNEIKFSTSLAN